MNWSVDRTKSNTIAWCTDSTHRKKYAHKVSGAGWIAYCIKTGNKMTGNFFKIADDAGSCRGEQLGLWAIHHLTVALCMFYGIEN